MEKKQHIAPNYLISYAYLPRHKMVNKRQKKNRAEHNKKKQKSNLYTRYNFDGI